jgi:hypothetical protein
MASEAQLRRALEHIRENITRYGLHVYVVISDVTPRFAYTIGLSESVGVELILAGAVFYMKDEVLQIIEAIASELKTAHERRTFEVTGLGSFSLRQVHATWAAEFILGAFDYYQKRDIEALQIVPDEVHWTLDVPDMTAPWSATEEPVWRWLREPWTFPVPKDSTALTDLAALQGEPVTEAARWEEDYWELFAGCGPDVPKDEQRVVALGTLVAADPSLAAVMKLEVGAALWRDGHSEWLPWGKKQSDV